MSERRTLYQHIRFFVREHTNLDPYDKYPLHMENTNDPPFLMRLHCESKSSCDDEVGYTLTFLVFGQHWLLEHYEHADKVMTALGEMVLHDQISYKEFLDVLEDRDDFYV